MSDAGSSYTLTTEDVREAYANGVWNDGVGRAGPEVDTEFQRWLVAHDAATRNAALEEAAAIAEGEFLTDNTGNPEDFAYDRAISDVARAIRGAKEVTP